MEKTSATPAKAMTRRSFLCAAAPLLAGLSLLPTEALAQAGALLGRWSLAWQGAQSDYTGTLSITTRVNSTTFRGRLILHRSDGATVIQNASIAIQGNQVSIICSRPSVRTWNPDRFFVTLTGNRMEGFSRDTAGQQGQSIVFNKR